MSLADLPEEFGLKMVGKVESGYSYQWDTFAVWKDPKTGDLYYKSDSGCSCSYPFMDDTLQTLIRVDPANPDAVASLVRDLDAWVKKNDDPNADRARVLLRKLGLKVAY